MFVLIPPKCLRPWKKALLGDRKTKGSFTGAPSPFYGEKTKSTALFQGLSGRRWPFLLCPVDTGSPVSVSIFFVVVVLQEMSEQACRGHFCRLLSILYVRDTFLKFHFSPPRTSRCCNLSRDTEVTFDVIRPDTTQVQPERGKQMGIFFFFSFCKLNNFGGGEQSIVLRACAVGDNDSATFWLYVMRTWALF